MNAPAHPASRLLPLEVQGPAGRIEALIQEREGEAPPFVAVICHPHPLYGGTMHNKVTHRVASTLFARGAVVLRFNFRGVGRSEGVHDRGRGDPRHTALSCRARWAHTRRPPRRYSCGRRSPAHRR